MGKRIFIVDDEPAQTSVMSQLLRENGYDVDTENDPEEGCRKILSKRPDLVLLDIRMPKMDGLDVCRTIKSDPQAKSIPILFISSRTGESDVVVGLELGADDYIHKPVRKAELLARVKTALRRLDLAPEPSLLVSGPIQLDASTHKATVDGKPIHLNPKEFLLMALFMKREGQVITRQVISELVWGTGFLPTSNTISTHVDSLRRKLGPYRAWITALKGIGYRFEPAD